MFFQANTIIRVEQNVPKLKNYKTIKRNEFPFKVFVIYGQSN